MALIVNLITQTTQISRSPGEWPRDYIGSEGLGPRLLCDLTEADDEPLLASEGTIALKRLLDGSFAILPSRPEGPGKNGTGQKNATTRSRTCFMKPRDGTATTALPGNPETARPRLGPRLKKAQGTGITAPP
ncbi:MAG: hypothetical protein JMJ93_00900 [Synergistaceae bacterium]|jgi:hypothetical protein|nr:hypothetical protein [Synergistaceae bacterium]